jgi:hypothetical protein
MASIRKLRAIVHEEDAARLDEFDGFMPTLEVLLTEGTRADINRYADQLAKWADRLAGYAKELAFKGDRDNYGDHDRRLWREIEEEGDLARVLFCWQWHIVFRTWSRILRRSPAAALRRLGE